MKKEIINSNKISGTYAGSSAHGIKAGNFLFVTGQYASNVNVNPKDDRQGPSDLGTLKDQTTRVMENIKAILEEAGTSFDNVVKRNVYITHVSDFDQVYEVMEPYFTSPVASTGLLTGLIPRGARVEIDVIAVVPD